MNRQPYGTPPRWWEPKLSPTWVKLTRAYRWRNLRRVQRLVSVDADGLDHVRKAVAAGHGVLITPNHPAHYDSAALYVALDRIAQPVFLMTAWQVFSMSGRVERWLMQRLGCFSIDRESNDWRAYKQAVRVLKNERYPLVIFPEGDIYHVTDRVRGFREGAAAIALSAAKRSDRPLVIIPCAIKFWYVEDPTGALLQLLERLEQRVLLRPRPEMPLTQRIGRLAEAVLALKELDFFGKTQPGTFRERISRLSESILARLEAQHNVNANGGTVPQRVKGLRQCIIRKAENGRPAPAGRPGRFGPWQRDMEDLFFVMQLYSYPGDDLDDHAPIERLAETLDKFEEDILGVELPAVRARRRVTIRFGPPFAVTRGGDRRRSVAQLTRTIQEAVQQTLDELNAAHGA